ncbi:MAG: hypothetical protein WC464_01130 [Bdellovibrionales bacterium]
MKVASISRPMKSGSDVYGIKQRLCHEMYHSEIRIGLAKNTHESSVSFGIYTNVYDAVLIASPSQKITCTKVDMVVPAHASVTHYNRKRETVGFRFWASEFDFDGRLSFNPGLNHTLGFLGEYYLTSKGAFVGSGYVKPVSAPGEVEIAETILSCLRNEDPEFAKKLRLTPQP